MDIIESYRFHPSLHALFKSAEARHLTEDELQHYETTLPDCKSRADAAREIAKVDTAICGKIAKKVTEAYEYDKHHDVSTKKCFRDISLTVNYATLSMLMNDPDWYRDKLLIWFKTILHSFRFPDQKNGQEALIDGTEHAEQLASRQPFQKSIFETYSLLKAQMKASLSESAYKEIEPYLQLALDILSND
ncbi:hypothetical protein [Rubellicoccus peritrichatus]|uniref:Phycobilisome protein n=1 Tax=Rubellicoccus peritrichatus TaxID=3080537 RepID=A0AAQ3LD45_9BACT|nr:hypothetical protein [Puniceicoccus sp. CR14]WOO41368.1 hypothetical protein RZN69_22340 [Puniceicoccus sp. CR14]